MVGVFEHLVYPLFRRIEFRGKRRLRPYLPVARSGSRVVGFAGGMRLRLSLSEPLHRDYFIGVLDLVELGLIRRLLRAKGGDFIDVGAHIGAHTVTAALATSGRVLAFEPNPHNRSQLEANLDLNGVHALVYAGAAGSVPGEGRLRIPTDGDASWSTLTDGRFADAVEVPVSVSTIDDQVARHALSPTMIKIDVEGGELDVLAGMAATLDSQPALLIEVSPHTAEHLDELLSLRGYEGFRIVGTKLKRGATGSLGIYNVFYASDEFASHVVRGS